MQLNYIGEFGDMVGKKTMRIPFYFATGQKKCPRCGAALTISSWALQGICCEDPWWLLGLDALAVPSVADVLCTHPTYPWPQPAESHRPTNYCPRCRVEEAIMWNCQVSHLWDIELRPHQTTQIGFFFFRLSFTFNAVGGVFSWVRMLHKFKQRTNGCARYKQARCACQRKGLMHDECHGIK